MLWHWLYFLELTERSHQGADGHPRRGDFYPPVEQPRRMFVGARSQRHRALRLGEEAQLSETILSCEAKQGSSGAMTLLTIQYEYTQAGKLCVEERRSFMYLPARTGVVPEPRTDSPVPVPNAPWSLDLTTDPVLLFKFSALTFNGHRIHYDRDYAQAEEGYPDLVVHGPLTALLLAELARARSDRPLRQFSFRALAPLFVGDTLRLRGEPGAGDSAIELAAYRPDGQVAISAQAG